MAKTTKTSKDATDSTPRPRFARYVVTLLLLCGLMLAWLSMLTFSPTDPPSPSVYRPDHTVQNRAGITGAYVAYGLRYWIGAGVYVAMAIGTVGSLWVLIGRRVSDWPWRLAGMIVLTTAVSAGARLADPSDAGEIVQKLPGILGTATGQFLAQKFGTTGSWVVVLAGCLIGAMLTIDTLMKALYRGLRGLWRRRTEMAQKFAELREARREAKEAARAEAAAAKAAEQSLAKTAQPRVSAVGLKPARRKPDPEPIVEEDIDEPLEDDTDDEPTALIPAKAMTPPPAQKKPKKRSAVVPKRATRKPVRVSDQLPNRGVLIEPEGGYGELAEEQAAQRQLVLQQTLTDFNVDATVQGYMTGPVITLFEVALAPGVKVAAITNLATDIARSLAVPGVRIVPPRFGKDTVGIEVPNLDKEVVRLRELMNLVPDAEKKMRLPLYLGKDAGGDAIVVDLARMPHMLIAGTTGSGKSVCINTIIVSLLLTRTAEDVRFILVDPKMVEMAAFEKLPHLLCPTINDMKKAEDILEWAVIKMDERYEILREAGVKNIAGFNALTKDEVWERFGCETEEDKANVPTQLPSYVIIIDELADMMMTSSKEVESYIIRIAQKARAVGIHLVLATQRPSANVVTGLIKSNMPCRVSFQVASGQESRIVLDAKGAEVLLGQGDMLVLQPGTSQLVRAQGTFVEDGEIRGIVKELEKCGDPQFDPELVKLQSAGPGDLSMDRDDMFDKAVEIVLATQRGSVSLLQRRLGIGYGRASRIIDQMAEAGILGDHKGSQARECMITLEDWEQMQASIAADQSGESSLNGEPTSV